jgi:SNF2 family DNA or RNA helicase
MDECLDLPEMTVQKRECEMTADQARLFKEMRKEMAAELASGTSINAVNGADKILKVLQIVGGSVKDPEGEDYQDIDCHTRINTLLEVIEEAEKKVIVFADFTGALRLIVKELRKHKISAEYVDGSVSQNKRNEIFDTFQNTKDIQVLVANSRTAAHGLTLTAATTICWWTPIFSLERFLQANGRVRRPGQTSKTTAILLGSSAFEWSVYDQLLEKDQNLNNVLDLYKKVVETH